MSQLKTNQITDLGGNELLTSNGSGVISGSTLSNTPSFYATLDATQGSGNGSASDNTDTKIVFDIELYDTGNCYDVSNGRFTPNVAGKYFIFGSAGLDINTTTPITQTLIAKNGTAQQHSRREFTFSSGNSQQNLIVSGILDANGSSDYFEIKVLQNSGGSRTIVANASYTFFGAYKVIGA